MGMQAGAKAPVRAAHMTTHDTDPHFPPPAHGGGSAETTEPGGPPDDAADGSSVALAISLLENVGEAELPAEGIAETHGHAAAAFSAHPHRPPRAHDAPHEDVRVLVNTTAPMAAVHAVPVVLDAPQAGRVMTTVPRARPVAPASPGIPAARSGR
ncbi:MAG TPA: hypothetical protein VLT33_16065, partial [Labilithrix sp.]|nr:hypothetical protein [Labilithrix sp.]